MDHSDKQSYEGLKSLNTTKHNRRSRSRHKRRVSAKEIARFHCDAFDQTTQNQHVYGSIISSASASNSNPNNFQQKRKQNKHYNYKRNKKRMKRKRPKLCISPQKATSTYSQFPSETNTRTQLTKEIRNALPKQQYITFMEATRNIQNFHKQNQNINRFEKAELIRTYLLLFNYNKRRHFLPRLSALLPQPFRAFYKQKVREIMTKKSAYAADSGSSLSPDTDWKCSKCSLENISENKECDYCGTQRSEHYSGDIEISSAPFIERPAITVNGYKLEHKLDARNAKRLEEKLERLRTVIKQNYNMRQLHYVFSAPILSKLSEFAPIHVEQLKYFDIAPMKIEKYGVEIVNEIKCFLHENVLVSPFTKVAPCVYCKNLFDRNVLKQHAKECVMQKVAQEEENVICDNVEEQEMIQRKEDDSKANEVIRVEVREDNDVNMKDVKQNDDDDKKENMDDDRDSINYFDDIDDSVFTQIIEEENDAMHEDKDGKKEADDDTINDEEIALDTVGFMNDDDLMRYLLKTEEAMKRKNETKNELEVKRAALIVVENKEKEIKRQKSKIQQQIDSLVQTLRSFS